MGAACHLNKIMDGVWEYDKEFHQNNDESSMSN